MNDRNHSASDLTGRIRLSIIKCTSMKEHLKRLWPICKWTLAIVIVGIIGYRIAGDVSQINWMDLTLRPGWLLLSGACYLAGLGCSSCFWYRLLWNFGQQPPLFPALRACYISHLGKYIPGKAVALIMRGSFIRGQGVNMGVAIIAAFYEVLTTMAAGALVAAVLFTVRPPQIGGLRWNPVFLGLLLMGLAGIPLMPAVFNRLVGGLASRFQKVEAFQLPKLRSTTLLQGIGIGAVGWSLMGLSTWALLQSVLPDSLPLTWQTWVDLTAMVSLSYVAGFLAIIVPGGVGVREELLRHLLPPVIAGAVAGIGIGPMAAVAVILLRLVWTISEVIAAAVLFCCRRRSRFSKEDLIDNCASNKM